MNHAPGNHPISFFDLFYLLKKIKLKMVFGALICAILGLLYATTRHVEYEAVASFREQSKSQPGVGGNTYLSSVLSFGVGNSNASEALSLMKSRKLLELLVKQLGLQATISKKEIRFDLLTRIRDNLLVEYAHLSKKQDPILEDFEPIFLVRDIDYTGRSPSNLKFHFLSEDTYEVNDRDGSKLVGKLGNPLTTKHATFTLLRNTDQPLSSQEYIISFNPMYSVIQAVSEKLNLETDRDDRLLIRLKYTCGMRCQAVELLNSLMALYQNHLRTEQQRILTEQIDYLHARQDHMQDKLQHMMEVHATTLASDAVSTGFLNSEKAMEFLAGNLQQYTQQLIAIELELKQLARVQREGSGYYDRLAAKDESAPINQTLSKIRSLKQQSDSLDLVLREATTDYKAAAASFLQQSTDLEKVRKLSIEAQDMVAALEKGKLPDVSLTLYNEPKYMVKAWCDKLMASHDNPTELKHCVGNFIAYLNNLIHLFQVHTKAIQERLTHQQSSHLEFQGLDLPTAQNLYVDYNKQMNAVEALLLQHRFIIEKMKDPDFEMSALSAILTDPVSRDMIDHAANAILALKDQNNRSAKEQERLKQELALQKGFLTAHLQQTVELQEIQRQLHEDKIRALQSATLGLTQQEISVLQEHLAGYIKTRIDNFTQEKEVIIQHQRELQQEMAKWPSQWVSEMLIEQQMEINKKMVEEITKLVESKNITSNLEVIRSAPVDLAITPPHPKSPKIPFFVLLGAFLGALLPYSLAVIRTLARGIPITLENLQLGNYPVAGKLSKNYCGESAKPLLDQDLETLRRIVTFLDQAAVSSGHGKSLLQQRALMLKGTTPDYSEDLAKLLAKKGLKVLLLPLSFDKQSNAGEIPGLLQYLENKATLPAIIRGADFDRIAAGGMSRFGTELLGTVAFQSLLKDLQQRYDWIIGISSAPLGNPEAVSILQQFPCAIITIKDEAWADLDACLKLDKKFLFIMEQE